MDGESLYYEANLKGPLVIVMGAEGKGMSPLTRRMCDFYPHERKGLVTERFRGGGFIAV